METILVMTLSGSGMLLLAMLWERITKDKYGGKIYYLLLKLSIVFFLLPLAILRDVYRILFREVFLWFHEMRGTQITQMKNLYFTYGKECYLSESLQMKWIVVIVWLMVALAILFIQLLQYGKCQKMLKKCGEVQKLQKDGAYVEKCAQRLGISRRVLLRPYDAEKNHNFTIGIFKPVIVYDPSCTEEERQQILRHELVHIRHLDMLWAVLMWAAVCVHWYNPFIWIMKGELAHAREMACDEETMKDCTRQERCAYVNLLYRQISEGKKAKYGMSLSRKGKQYKGRMINVMNMNKRKLGVTGVLGILAVVFLNTMTVFAYPEVSRFDMNVLEEQPNMEEVTSGDWVFVPEECVKENPYLAVYDIEILYEYQFVDEEGNIYGLTEAQFNGADTERVICKHVYETGQSTMHVSMPDGGCIVYVYESERCTLCGNVKNTEMVYKIESMKCMH